MDKGTYTPEMSHAERELDARIDHALGVAREVEARITEREKDMGDPEPPPSDENVERFKALVLGHARTPEWELVIDRIDEGELTWRQVVESSVTTGADREIAAAFASLSRVPPPDLDKLVEIGVVPAEKPDDATAPSDVDGGQPTGRGRRRIIQWPSA